MKLVSSASPVVACFLFLLIEGMREQQRRSAACEELKRVRTALRRKLERSLQVDLPTPEGSPEKRQKRDRDELGR